MRENERAEVFGQAIDAMVAKAVEQKRPSSPGAYAATVRADLRDRLHPVARDLYAKHGELTAEHLTILLEAHERPTTPEPPSPPSPAATLPPVPAPDTSPRMSRDAVRARIADAKAQLRNVTKPPMPTKEPSA